MSTTQALIDHAEAHCKKRGSRLTQKRKHILSGLLNSQKAMSAYDLVEYCKTAFDERIPPMSVYRILEFLQGEQLVHKLQLINKYVACSHIACDHDHEVPQFLICNQCGDVKEIGIKKSLINKLNTDIENAGYHLTSPQLELNCLCQNCVTSAA